MQNEQDDLDSFYERCREKSHAGRLAARGINAHGISLTDELREAIRSAWVAAGISESGGNWDAFISLLEDD